MIWRTVLVGSIILMIGVVAGIYVGYRHQDPIIQTLPHGAHLLCWDPKTDDRWAGKYDGQTFVCNPKDSPRYAALHKTK